MYLLQSGARLFMMEDSEDLVCVLDMVRKSIYREYTETREYVERGGEGEEVVELMSYLKGERFDTPKEYPTDSAGRSGPLIYKVFFRDGD